MGPAQHRAASIRWTGMLRGSPLLLACLLLVLLPAGAWADAVIASDRVQSFVVVREAPSRTSPRVGELRPG